MFRVGDEVIAAPAGSFVIAIPPRCPPHVLEWRRRYGTTAAVVTPGGLGRFYEDAVAAVVGASDTLDRVASMQFRLASRWTRWRSCSESSAPADSCVSTNPSRDRRALGSSATSRRTRVAVFAGGCHLGRHTEQAITVAGFEIDECDRFLFAPCWTAKVAAPHMLGRALRPT